MLYSDVLTREQFMFQEMRIAARLKFEGLDDQDIIAKVYEGNLFQYPTEREIKSKCYLGIRLAADKKDELQQLIPFDIKMMFSSDMDF